MSDDQTANSVGAADDVTSSSDDLLDSAGQGGQTPAADGEGGQQAAAGEGQEGSGDSQAGGDGDQQSAPEAYADFDVPEGIEIDKELLTQADPVFKELGLSQEQAQKLIDLRSAQVKAEVDQFNQRKKDWQDAARADEEIGGDKLDRSIAISNKVMFDVFEPSFVEELKAVGMLNHPELIRGLTRLGNKFYTEDSSGDTTNPALREKSRIERLYPDTTQE